MTLVAAIVLQHPRVPATHPPLVDSNRRNNRLPAEVGRGLSGREGTFSDVAIRRRAGYVNVQCGSTTVCAANACMYKCYYQMMF